VELANDINDHMPEHVVRRITAGLNRKQKSVNGSRVLVLGIAYKRNTSDARESPGRVIVDLLQLLGAVVRVADPYVTDPDVLSDGPSKGGPPPVLVKATLEEIEDADVVVIVTDHDDFDLEMIRDHADYVLDTRGRIDGPNVERL
jgi:UDP-N-acetyl-D-glucosamine dehydrogenase